LSDKDIEAKFFENSDFFEWITQPVFIYYLNDTC
jgi:hypothetical protein